MKNTTETILEESILIVDLKTFSTGEAEKLVLDLWSKGLIDNLEFFDEKNTELVGLDVEMERSNR